MFYSAGSWVENFVQCILASFQASLILVWFCLLLFPQPIYGFASGDPLRFRRALGHRDLFYVDDKDVDFKDVSSLLM